MNSLRFRLFFAMFVTVCVFPLCVCGQADLTSEQLVLLMKASREQYNTVTAKMKARSYQYIDGKADPILRSTREIISRWTKNSSFSRVVETQYPEVKPHKDYPLTTIYTHVITPKWSKRLIEADGRKPRGHVKPGRAFEQELPFYTVYTAMWGLCMRRLEEINLREATVTRDEKNNCYILTSKIGNSPQGPSCRLQVDPTKGYIPVVQEPLKPDGTPMNRYECSDFRQTAAGLWVPYRYSWLDPKVSYGAVYEVEELTGNEPIPENLLDFDFPKGTIVSDERIGSRYIVGTATAREDTTVDPCSQAQQTEAVTVTAPATDDELRSAAAKAKELIKAQSGTDKPSPAIEVSPKIVLVTPDKYEYKLSVKSDDGSKPVLLNHKFESDRLQLLSIENQIDDKKQLTIEVSRQQAYTGFAKGVLVLQFAGKTDADRITFVSGPLLDTLQKSKI